MGYSTVGFLRTELRQDRGQMRGRCNFLRHLFHHLVTHPLDAHPLKAHCQEASLFEFVYHWWWSNHEQWRSISMTDYTVW